MEKEKTTRQISIRLTETMANRLEAEADEQGRALANYIKAIIKDHIETLDRAKKIAERK